MLEGLINEYISKADDWNRIFSKMKFRTFSLCVSPVFILFSPLLLKFNNKIWWEYLSLLITLIPYFISFFMFNSKAKKVLGIKNKGFWNSAKNRKILHEFEVSIVEDYLKKINCYDYVKINVMVAKLKNIIKKNNIDIVLPVSISVLLLPIWEQWIALIFDTCKSSNQLSELIRILISSIISIVTIIFLFSPIKDTFKNIYNNIFNRRNENIQYLISILEDISFTLEINK
ncbi:hypothetical protein E4N72_00480 [Treponema vincentii]|uniref:hypothetical protein n=1 Tax=Treponema vincentii TaxID=69710 RepID=UPI0020A238A0|nr:hypothetical protein [Treponema vincentii]UTC45166.1 hypothetical protein E4N72_00480 [Treponema vincentii]